MTDARKEIFDAIGRTIEAQPYVADNRGSYWVCIDLRSGEPVSYPTSKGRAVSEAKTMNAAYQEAKGATA